MEVVITEHKETSKTLTGVTPVSHESDDLQTVMKPSTEETAGNDSGSVVVTTTVVEETVKETEVSVVDIVREEEEEGGNNEVTETEKEGLFGNLVGEDEGLKVNCGENGTSLVMEVDTSLAGVNGSYIDSIFEHDENASADPMDVCPPEQNEKNGDNETEVIELKEDMNKADEENVVNMEDDNNGKEDMSKTDEENVVNGEDNNRKELAGDNETEIVDNETEIVELKEDMNKTDEENVVNMEDNNSKTDDENVVNGEDNNGKELAGHVEEEDHKFVVGDFVWGKIKNKLWWPGQIYDSSDASENAASLEHEGELLVAYIGDRSFSWCSPSQLKPFTDNFQEMSSQSDSKKFVNAVQKVLQEVGRRMELMCKGRSVNTNEKGGVNSGIKKGARAPKGNTIKVLIDRLEPVELVSTLKGYATMEPGAGLVDLEFTILKSCLTAFYTRNGGSEEETPRAVNGPDGDVKSHQKRKQKSVAELMGEDESKIKKAKLSKDKRKALVVSVAPESDESGGGGFEEETMSPRQRKKSRYLSPPYFSPVGLGRFSVLGSGTGSGSFKEPQTEPEKVPEVGDEQLEDSLKKSNGKKKKAREHKKKADTGGSVVNVLDGLLSAALDPSSFVQKEKNLPEIMELVSSFRGSIFKEGSCKQTGMKKEGFQQTGIQKEGEEPEDDISELGFIKQKLEWMSEMVQMCEESDMSADVKASLEGGLQEVLGKVVEMEGK